ncbi:small GTP-binding protein domain protein [Desulfosporosinus orientis DSM 765]|uniref:Small GTP-binding protein domain protein n=1 Tax=Desulfosporosinus orientis (strain ATCC 19365 / DSM 765 / NCIMB 8382 / VKM B-1628 / Singapore I) TaxID=768706 RepID=G7WDS2_DESOD|nr:elongation factor G [Desulfosporosinus orientis]AET68829.1 small GTP-binding protein domain protein [Desulfosporosinus orientis DSM 765]
MKTYDTDYLRNVCLVGHGGAGKTSLGETILFNSGAITRIGKVSEGNTVSDFLPEEVKHQVSISTSLMPFEWGRVKVNLLDSPGYLDFLGEVKSGLRVAECGVLVLCGVAGLEVQAEIAWGFMEEQKLPKIIFVNKLDRKNANFGKVLDQLKDAYPEARMVPLQLPLGQESSFNGVIDILENKAYVNEDNESGKYSTMEVPEKYKEEVELLREQLAEAVAEADDDILMKYLEGETLSEADLQTALRKALKQNLMMPVLCGSAVKNIGITRMMDFLVDYAPAPEVHEQDVALVFKTLADSYVGKMSFFRVYGGEFKAETWVLNSTNGSEEKIGQPLFLRGKNQEPVASVSAGDIAVIAKLQEVKTGDTLCNKEYPVQLEGIDFPVPTLSVAIGPKTKGDEDRLGGALTRLIEEDPTLTLHKNTETKELILTGMGEMQLEILQEKLARKFGVDVTTKVPRVPYRETIRKAVKVEGKHKKQTGGHGQYGHVWINLEPYSDSDFEFAESIFGGAVPKQYIPAVEKGIREAMTEGAMVGYPVTDIKVTLCDGSYHAVDSSEMAFKLAAILAFRKGVELAMPTLLEPIVELEVKVPEAFMGDVIADLNGKRGRVLGMDASGKFTTIHAHVPQAEMMRYAIDLRSLTQGRGSFTMKFLRYEEVPRKLSETLVNQLKASNNQ